MQNSDKMLKEAEQIARAAEAKMKGLAYKIVVKDNLIAYDEKGPIEDVERQAYYGNTSGSLPSMLSRHYPLYVNDAIPPSVKDGLEKNNTFACTDGKYVYFDEALFKAALPMLLIADKDWERLEGILKELEGVKEYPAGLVNEVADIATKNAVAAIGHEYSHLMLQHPQRKEAISRRIKDENSYRLLTVAIEIEANSSAIVPHNTAIYELGLTVDKFPCCQGVKGLTNIYNVLKENYGSDIDEAVKQAASGGQISEDSKLTDEQKEAIQRNAEDLEKQAQEMEGKSINSEETESITDKNNYDLSNQDNQTSLDDLEQGTEAVEYGIAQTINKEQLMRATKLLKGLITGKDIATARVKTYSRIARRPYDGGLIRKGSARKLHNAPRMLLAIDCSGSLSSTPASAVSATIAKLLRVTGTPLSGSYACLFNGGIVSVHPFRKWQDLIDEFDAFGGTNYDAVMRQALDSNVELVLNVGDADAELCDENLLRLAKKKGLRWVDIGVTSDAFINNQYWTRREQENLPEDALIERLFISLAKPVNVKLASEDPV